MNNLDVHNRVGADGKCLYAAPSEFVHRFDRVGLPVGPIEGVLKHGDREWLVDLLTIREHNFHVRSIQLGRANLVELSIDPVDSLTNVIYEIKICRTLIPKVYFVVCDNGFSQIF